MICRILNRVPAEPGGIATDALQTDPAASRQIHPTPAATPPRG